MNLALVLAFLAVVMAVFIVAATSAEGGLSLAPYLIAGIGGAVLLPVLAYPVSLTLWCAVDFLMRRRLGGERLDVD
jgi:hypothetical protein